MPYAAYDHLSTDEFEGSIYITFEQYQQGVQALGEGRHVHVIDGQFVINDEPEPEDIVE
jgi:hypothetical protein